MKIKKILISQPEPTNGRSPYFDVAKQVGAEVEFRKFIQMEGLTSKEFRDQRISILDHLGVVLTSRVAVDNYFRLAESLRCDIPVEMRYFCLSEAIANYLQKYIVYRKRKIFFSKDGTAPGLMNEMNRYKEDHKFLIPMSEVHSPQVPNLLKDNGYDFTEAIMYRTISTDLSDLDVNSKDMILFFSPLGVASLFHNYPDYVQGERAIGVFGQSTEAAAKKAGLRVDIMAPSPKAPSMKMALEQYLKL